MPRRDEIDLVLAKHFAWSFVRPEDTSLVDEKLAAIASRAADAHRPDAEQASAPVDGPQAQEQQAHNRATCQSLVAAIATAWATTDDPRRFLATKRLLARAGRLGLEIFGMDVAPVEGVRLLRLFVRYRARMTRRQREQALSVASLIPLDHPETADLLVEIARAGERPVAEAIFAEEGWLPGVGDEDSLVARLADVIDDGPTHEARAVAIEIVARFERREPAQEALRRALRLPSFAVRARALEALATATPCLLGSEGLVRVLRDLVTHAPPDPLGGGEEREQDERLFAEAVLAALAHVRPDDAAEALLDWIDAEHDALWLDAAWATEALAVGFPETAAVMVDHWLRCAHAHDRMRALGALERLPDDLARPRLALAAADPSATVREPARHQWLARFAQPFPLSPRALLGSALLTGEPGERFLSRLGVLHGRVGEARQAMGRALLAEAPDPCALVLLLQMVADDTESAEPLSSSREGGWAQTIVERFGPVGVRGLCAIAARFPEPEVFGWMRRLGDLVERGVISREQAMPVRELAARHVLSDDAGQVDDALRLLALVGAPPTLLDRVLTLALSDDLGSWEARKLIVAWPDRTTDTRLSSEMALALADRDWSRLENASWMALGRGAAAARVVALRVLEVVLCEEEALSAAVTCARGLRELRVLDDAWAVTALGRPDSALFVVAARAWRGSAAVRAELESALASPARSGTSAAEAALSLLACEPPWNRRDRRLSAVLAAAPLQERAELVSVMCVRGAPFGAIAPHLDALFTSSDPQVVAQMQGLLGWLKSPKLHALLRQILPRVIDADLRSEIEEELGHARPSYWAER